MGTRRSNAGGSSASRGSLHLDVGPPQSAEANFRRTADVYMNPPGPPPGFGRKGISPRTSSKSPPLVKRGLPSLREHPSGGSSSGRLSSSWVAGGVGSREELEQALSSAQTALVMAKERIALLEQQNAQLRAQKARGGSGGAPTPAMLTKEKLVEASQLRTDGMITEADFAAIKGKYLQDVMGLQSE